MTSTLNWLPKQTVALTERAVSSVLNGLGEKVVVIALVGAAVHPPRHSGRLLPELLVVVSDLPVAAIGNLAHQIAGVLGEGVKLHILTQQELLRSADVFTLELAEYRDRHALLYGSDPFGEIYYTPAELRRSLEQGLRAMGRRVRQRVLEVLGSQGQPDDPAKTLIDGFEQLVVCAHHILKLLGESPPQRERELITKLTELSGSDGSTLIELVDQIRAAKPITKSSEPLENLMRLIEEITNFVDTFGVGPDGLISYRPAAP